MRSRGLTSGVCKRIRRRSSKPRRLVAREASSSELLLGLLLERGLAGGTELLKCSRLAFAVVSMIRDGSFCMRAGFEVVLRAQKEKVENVGVGYVLFIDFRRF